jgi:protein tyrosine/serine phosphatase
MQFQSFSRVRRYTSFCVLLVFATACADASDTASRGLPNFQKINDKVYRGGQPTDEGFSNLAALGVKTIVDLGPAGEHSQAEEQKLVESNGMRYVSVPMKGMSTPSAESVSSVLSLLENTSAGPVFVHCQRGADRTGAVIACYRIQHDRWSSNKALDEAGGLGMSWYQLALKNYVAHFAPLRTATLVPAAIVPSAPQFITQLC